MMTVPSILLSCIDRVAHIHVRSVRRSRRQTRPLRGQKINERAAAEEEWRSTDSAMCDTRLLPVFCLSCYRRAVTSFCSERDLNLSLSFI